MSSNIAFPSLNFNRLHTLGVRVLSIALAPKEAPQAVLTTFPQAQGVILGRTIGGIEPPEHWLAFSLDTPLRIASKSVFNLALVDLRGLSRDEASAANFLLMRHFQQGVLFVAADPAERERLKLAYGSRGLIEAGATLVVLPRGTKKWARHGWPAANDWVQIFQRALQKFPRAVQLLPIEEAVKPAMFTPEGFGLQKFEEAAGWQAALVRGGALEQRPPLLPPTPAEQAAIIAAGGLETVRLRQNGREVVLRGRTMRVLLDSEKIVRNEDGRPVTQRARVHDFDSDVLALYPSERRAVRMKVNDPSFTAFLKAWGEALHKHLRQHLPAAYHPKEGPFWEVMLPHLVDSLLAPFRDSYLAPLPGHEHPHLADGQAHIAAALVLALLGQRALKPKHRAATSLPRRGYPATLLRGEPGSGKTAMLATVSRALARDYAWRYRKTFQDAQWPFFAWVSPPGNIDHIRETLRDVAPEFYTVEVRNPRDVHRALRAVQTQARPVMLLIPRTALREDEGTRISVLHRKGHTLHCPTCGAPVSQMIRTQDGDWVASSSLPDYCPICAAPLYQTAGDIAINVPSVLKRQSRRLGLLPYFLVVDEVHEDKSRNSQQGEGMGVLASVFQRVVAMTGTVGGTADDLFYLMRRLFPWAFPREGESPLASSRAFLRRFGRYRETWFPDEERKGRRLHPMPGVSPEVAAQILGPRSVALQVADLGIPLKPREEILVPVDLSPAERDAYDALVSDVMGGLNLNGAASERTISASAAPAVVLRVAPSAWHHLLTAPWSPAFKCSVCNQPLHTCEHRFVADDLLVSALDEQLPIYRRLVFTESAGKDKDEGFNLLEALENKEVAEPFLDEDFVSSKEQALLRIVEKEQAEGRSVLVFTAHSGRFGLGKRLAWVLGKHGYPSADLTGIPGDKIIDAAHKWRNARAFILGLNAATGLNLDEFAATVVLYDPDYRAALALQATRRVDRATQNHPVRVYYLYARGTGEEAIMARQLSKMVFILLLGGADAAGLGALGAEELGHERSTWEAMVDVVKGRSHHDLERAVGELASAWRQVRTPSGLFVPVPENLWKRAEKDRKVVVSSLPADALIIQGRLALGKTSGRQGRGLVDMDALGAASAPSTARAVARRRPAAVQSSLPLDQPLPLPQDSNGESPLQALRPSPPRHRAVQKASSKAAKQGSLFDLLGGDE